MCFLLVEENKVRTASKVFITDSMAEMPVQLQRHCYTAVFERIFQKTLLIPVPGCRSVASFVAPVDVKYLKHVQQQDDCIRSRHFTSQITSQRSLLIV